MVEDIDLIELLKDVGSLEEIFKLVEERGLKIDVGNGRRPVLSVGKDYIILGNNVKNDGEFIYGFRTGDLYKITGEIKES